VPVTIALLHGCGGHRAEVPTAAPDIPGTVRPGRAGLVVAAPHAGGDVHTGDMAAEIARRTGFGLVVAAPDGVAGPRYAQRVAEAAQGPVRFYAELHRRVRGDCAGGIDIATVGVDPELALRLRALVELIRDAHLRASREVPRLDVVVEPADRGGAAGERVGRLAGRALQIELPACARADWREVYTAILADFLAQSVLLQPGR
jgi:hypothetical protein